MNSVVLTTPNWPTNAFTNSGLYNVKMARCGLTQTSVDNIIINVAAIATYAGPGVLDLGNSGTLGALNSARGTSAPVNTAVSTLQGLGWNVTTA